MTRPRIPRADLLLAFALVLATAAAYASTAQFGFLGYDDGNYVKDNMHLPAGLAPGNLNWIFLSFQPDNWFPITRLSLILDYRMFGLNAAAYHVENVAIHCLAALLLFGFLRRATGVRWPCAFVAFVFALHPLHVESVAWVAERKDVLCAAFWFATLWAWLRYTERPAAGRYLAALFLFALGLMAKPMIVTLPFLLFLMDGWPLRREFSRNRVVEKIPFLVLSAAVAGVTILAQHGALQELSQYPPRLRLENALISVAIYLAHTFWPGRLWTPYAYPEYVPLWQSLGAALGIALVSAWALLQFRARPWLATGWFWFLGTLMPVIGLVQVGEQGRADRYMYVPMVGLSVIVAWGAADLAGRWRRLRRPITALAVAACLALGVRTWFQTQYWHATDVLFRHAIDEDPQNYLAWNELGQTFIGDPHFRDQVIEAFRQATLIRPDYVPAINNLGVALTHTGRYTEAIAEFEAAFQIDPGYSGAHYNLGATLEKLGRKDEALRQFETAVAITPDFAKAQNELGANLWNAGRTTEGLAHLELAVRLDPDSARARFNLGAALLRVPGRKSEAISHLNAALRLKPDLELRKQIELLEREPPVVPR